jgi:hypothetical protein
MSNKHMMMIEFTQTYSFVDVPMVALYNETQISEEEVRKKIKDRRAENDDFIVVMFKSQYDNLKDLIEPNPQKEKDFYEELCIEQQGGII